MNFVMNEEEASVEQRCFTKKLEIKKKKTPQKP